MRFESLKNSEEKLHVKILQRIYLKYNPKEEDKVGCLCDLQGIRKDKEIYYNWYYGAR